MTDINIVRAWKDETYRQSLSASEQAALPINPAGMIELDDADLVDVSGGTGTGTTTTIIISNALSCWGDICGPPPV